MILLGSLKVEGIKKRDLDMSRCGVRKLCKEVDFELTSRGKGSDLLDVLETVVFLSFGNQQKK